MKAGNKYYRTIWEKPRSSGVIQIIDQRLLPHKFVTCDLKSLNDFIKAIKDMYVRGAPLIGVTAAYGLYVAMVNSSKNSNPRKTLENSAKRLKATRPTAINLAWAVDYTVNESQKYKSRFDIVESCLLTARHLADDDVARCKKIGENGLNIIRKISKNKNGKPVNILTHCNAGWLATVDYGTALAPIYLAHKNNIEVHVWVDETRPRNQGAKLTAWELAQEGIPHTLIVDNTGGHLMQMGMVDMVIVGSDRTTANGDVANKIGTYLKALAAKDNNIPFYAAMPISTIDISIENGSDIPIEIRHSDEVKYMDGFCNNKINKVLISPEDTTAVNFGFDVTPARLVTGIITEKGVVKPNKKSIMKLFE